MVLLSRIFSTLLCLFSYQFFFMGWEVLLVLWISFWRSIKSIFFSVGVVRIILLWIQETFWLSLIKYGICMTTRILFQYLLVIALLYDMFMLENSSVDYLRKISYFSTYPFEFYWYSLILSDPFTFRSSSVTSIFLYSSVLLFPFSYFSFSSSPFPPLSFTFVLNDGNLQS